MNQAQPGEMQAAKHQLYDNLNQLGDIVGKRVKESAKGALVVGIENVRESVEQIATIYGPSRKIRAHPRQALLASFGMGMLLGLVATKRLYRNPLVSAIVHAGMQRGVALLLQGKDAGQSGRM
jgi:hypothetical protein